MAEPPWASADAGAVVLRARPGGGARSKPRDWVIDTGASKHVCGPDEAARAVRPDSTVVETANGDVRAVGVATVDVPGIGRCVDALVLPGAPKLLSAGSLVEEGYELRWRKGRCTLKPPGGQPIALRVVDGIPTLPAARHVAANKSGDQAAAGRVQHVLGARGGRRGGRKASSRKRAQEEHDAHAHTVREGVEHEHRQQGHYPWNGECTTCNEVAMRSKQHRRRLPHTGTLSVDVAALSQGGPYVLVGATQAPGYTYAERLPGRSAKCLVGPLLRMLAAARRRGEVHTIHADREGGLQAVEQQLLGVGCKLSCTQGYDPQANGLAEATVGILSRMARAVLYEYPASVAGKLWAHAMVWAAQRLGDPGLPPFGAKVLVRHGPNVVLSKLARRASPAVYLHKGAHTSGAACVGLLSGDGTVAGTAERVTTRAVLSSSGMWQFPAIHTANLELRGRPAAVVRPGGDPPLPRGGATAGEDTIPLRGDGENTNEPGGDERAWEGEGVTENNDDYDEDEDDLPLGVRGGAAFNEEDIPLAEVDDLATDEDDIPLGARVLGPAPPPAVQVGGEGGSNPASKRKRGSDDGDDESGAGRPAQRTKGLGDDVPDDGEDDPMALGMVTRVVPMRSAEARTEPAQAAIQKELSNIVSKGVFRVDTIHDWSEVRTKDETALVGSAMMILGCKNSELAENMRAYKGRMVFQGNRVQAASGGYVFGAPDDLYGKPVDLCMARTVVAAALLNDWGVDAGDVDGAYLNAPLRGPAVYMRLPPALWEALGVPCERLSGVRDPCVKLQKALYGLPRSGFDWYAAFHDMLTKQLGWSVVPGYDSVYRKKDALLAVYVDDVIVAGTQRARRREWAALSAVVKLKDKPQPIDRFLGVRYSPRHVSTYKREMRMCQEEYIQQLTQRYDAEAAHPAGKRAAPAAKISGAETVGEAGAFSDSCRSYVGALMYVSRATRPDITFATNWLARYVSRWCGQQDRELGHLVGYLGATSACGLVAEVDVRDRGSGLWLELWVDSDHAGEPGRRSTTGWLLMLRGQHGTAIPLDWASRKQATVARSSGEAETVALHDALGRVVGANRALCSSGIPALDAVEKLLGQSVELRVKVDASVCKAAAEKGTSTHMKYISKSQGVDLFWMRDIVQRLGVRLEKVSTTENAADLLTKPLCGQRTEVLREAAGVKACGQRRKSDTQVLMRSEKE